MRLLMKLVLNIWSCLFISNECSSPVQHDKKYNSWNECVVEEINYSTNFVVQQKNEDVNEFKLANKFMCKEIENV